MKKIKIALFGGTFDPIHLGHTTVAAEAAKYIGADKVVFVPANCSPLKGFTPIANGAHRFKMTALAIADQQNFEVSDYELKKSAPSYTLETVVKFKNEYKKSVIYWLIGADSIDDLVHWHRIVKLIDICNLTTMYRAGCAPPDFTKFKTEWGHQCIEKLQHNIIQTSLVDISSTKIRNRLAAGGDVSDVLHPAVAAYIREHRLYQSKT
jgi:nicotinate-nucleotide adenylyltransferase